MIKRGIIVICFLVVMFAVNSNAQTIYGCVNAKGTLRIVSGEGQCKSKESLISWNQAGAPGPKGDKGDLGPQGPMGPVGSMFVMYDDSGQLLGSIVSVNPQILYDGVSGKFHSLNLGPAFYYLDDGCTGQVLESVAFFNVGGTPLHPVYPYLYIPGIPPQDWAIQNGPNAYYTPTDTVISVDQFTRIYQKNIFADPNQCLLMSQPGAYYVMEPVQMGFNTPVVLPTHVVIK